MAGPQEQMKRISKEDDKIKAEIGDLEGLLRLLGGRVNFLTEKWQSQSVSYLDG
jgi:hypothetical protein